MVKKRLGRGLDALLSDRSISEAPSSQASDSSPEVIQHSGGQPEVDIYEVQPSPYQPRRHFAHEALEDLASSIRSQGLLQPIVVRPRAQGGYELIAGERRWRAAQLAGLTTIPAVIKTVTDQEASALALIENMQREDLNAMEEAMGLARLRDEFALTQQQIADAVGKSRVAIANLLRLMNLGTLTRQFLERGDIEMGHARALLAVDGMLQDQLAQRVVDQGLSVRQTENLVRNPGGDTKAKRNSAVSNKDPDTRRLEQRITEQIGAPTSIKHSAQGKGELTIKYSSLEELDGVLKHLGISHE